MCFMLLLMGSSWGGVMLQPKRVSNLPRVTDLQQKASFMPKSDLLKWFKFVFFLILCAFYQFVVSLKNQTFSFVVVNSFVVVVDTVGTNLILAVYASHDYECNTGSTACCTSTIHAWNNAPMAQHTVR